MTTIRRPKSRKTSPGAQLRVVPAADPSVVRLSRVRSVQKRIEAGYYDRDEVRDRLVRAVLGEILRG
jgi:hypothetical protein